MQHLQDFAIAEVKVRDVELPFLHGPLHCGGGRRSRCRRSLRMNGDRAEKAQDHKATSHGVPSPYSLAIREYGRWASFGRTPVKRSKVSYPRGGCDPVIRQRVGRLSIEN